MNKLTWFWRLLTHLAHVVVKIDDAIWQIENFWHFLFGDDDDEPMTKKRKND